MNRKLTKALCLMLSVIMLFGVIPMQAVAEAVDVASSKVEYPTGDSDGLILEFSSAGALEVFRAVYGGRTLGGNMLLVDGSYAEAVRYEKMPNIESVTYNYTLAAAGIAEDFGTMPADPDMSKTKVSAPFLKFMSEVGDEAGLSSLYTVRVAVLDTGIDATHEDLANRVVTGYDAINDEVISKGVNSDVGADGHGTKVAGLIGAEADNGLGFSGMAGRFPVELIPVRVLDENGNGRISDVVCGIYWAIDNGADILNMSFGAKTAYYPTALANAIRDARRQNVLALCAGGNTDDMLYRETYEGFYPADLAGAYPVLGGDYSLATNDYYSFKHKQGDRNGIDYVGHTGRALFTTDCGGGYTTFTGTSASCAAIAGYTAVMFSLLGGRTNPEAINAVKNFYVYGHGGQTDSYQTYHVYRFNDMAYMQDSVKEAFIDAIKATRVTIQGSIACRNVLTGTAEIVGKLTMGASLAKDATLVACKADGTVLYTSAPVAKTETAQTEYIFTLDTSSFEDGEITLKIFYRTAAEAAAGKDATTVINFSEYTAIIRNSLMVTTANVYIYDADGSQISGEVTIRNAETGEFVATAGSALSPDLVVAKQLFDQCGGLLTFSFIKDDMVYIKTTAFAPEIILGGDEVQKTTLHFRSDAVTLAQADVFLCYGDTEIQVGVTDAAGDLTLCLSDGEFRFLVRDAERRYLILATAVQDGNKMEISLAADIDAAQEVTVTSVDSLGEGDRWTIAASGSQLRTARDGVSLGAYEKEIRTVYLSPAMQHLAVGIYDRISMTYQSAGGSWKTVYRYYHVTHLLGEVDVSSMGIIDFDPTRIITTLDIGADTLVYGEKTTVDTKAVDNRGNLLVGGEVQMEAFPDSDTWRFGNANSFSMKSANPADTQEYYSKYGGGLFDPDNGILESGNNNWPQMPIAECDYILTARFALDTALGPSDAPYTGYLSYQFNEATGTVHVRLGKMMAIRMESFNGDGDVYGEAMIIRNGKIETPSRIGNERGDDGSRTLFLDASSWDATTEVFVSVSLGGKGGGVTYFDYFRYDPENPTRTIAVPDLEFGALRVCLGSEDNQVYAPTLFVEYGGHTFAVSVQGGVPVGSYYVGGFTIDYKNDIAAVYYRHVDVPAEGATLILKGEEFREYTVNNNSEDTRVTLLPILGNQEMPNSEKGDISVYRSQKLLLDSGVTALYAKLTSYNFNWRAGFPLLCPKRRARTLSR